MTDTPPVDGDSFRSLLLRTAGGGVGLVAVVALAFGVVGGLGDDPDAPVVAEAPEDDDETAAPPEDTDDGDDGEESDEAAEDDDAADDEADEEPEPEEGADEGETGENGDADDDASDDEADEDTDTADDQRQFAPDGVTVQVLDGYQADGGGAASAVAATLREHGYSVLAENPARRYEVTTVLFTPGFEGQARQVAADLSAAQVQQQPGNLSESVQVHVVVGADRG